MSNNVDETARVDENARPTVRTLTTTATGSGVRQTHIVALDGLRGFAALCVAVMHIGAWLGLPHLLGHAYHAVDLFFVLSGFVVAASYEPRLSRGRFLPEFIYRRAARLAPMLVLGAIAGFAATNFFAEKVGFDALLLALLCLPTLGTQEIFPLNPAEWSLLFEIIANLLHALCVRWLTTTRLAIALAVLAVLGLLLDASYKNLNGGHDGATFILGLWRVLYGYGAGILLYRLWVPRRLPAPATRFGLLLIVMGIEFAIPGHVFDWFRDPLFILVISPALVCCAVSARVKPNVVALANVFGKLSYPLYLIHWPVLLIAMRVLPDDASVLARLCLVLATTLTAVCAAWASLAWFDQPVRRVLGKWPRRAYA